MSEGAFRALPRGLGVDSGAGALCWAFLEEECRGVDRSREGGWCC